MEECQCINYNCVLVYIMHITSYYTVFIDKMYFLLLLYYVLFVPIIANINSCNRPA